jgi:Ca2+-dependent lipid-binding protein
LFFARLILVFFPSPPPYSHRTKKSHPFSSFSSPAFTSISTGVQWSTLNPVWDARWELLNVTDESELEIHIKDKDKMKEDTPLGKAVLVLGANLEGTREHILDIVRPDGRVHGQVIVHVSFCFFDSLRRDD